MICVPSKQRLTSVTIRRLMEEELRPVLFVDEEEFDDYAYAYPGASIIPTELHDIGLLRARMLEFARNRGEDFCWQIDDDVTRVMIRLMDGKYRQVSWWAALDAMEAEMRAWPTAALGGPVPIQYASRMSPEPVLNGHHNGIVLIRTAAPVQYEYGVIEDMDIVCQAWDAGWHTVRWPRFAYDCPKMGTSVTGGVSQGGMREAYDAGWQEPRRDRTLEKWEDSGYIVRGGRYGFHLSRKTLSLPERVA